ncbi:hypothetical protein CHUAL_007677 [Chamberlinius hualienensis]
MAKHLIFALSVLLLVPPEFRPYKWSAEGQDYYPSRGDDACITSSDIRPVCGSDGISYNNPSALFCARRQNPGLMISHEGPCNQY